MRKLVGLLSLLGVAAALTAPVGTTAAPSRAATRRVHSPLLRMRAGAVPAPASMARVGMALMAQSEADSPLGAMSARSRSLSVASVLAAAFLNFLGFTMMLGFTPTLAKHFGLDAGARFGSITSAYPLGMLAGVFIWPALSDRVGRKPVLALSLLGSVSLPPLPRARAGVPGPLRVPCLGLWAWTRLPAQGAKRSAARHRRDWVSCCRASRCNAISRWQSSSGFASSPAPAPAPAREARLVRPSSRHGCPPATAALPPPLSSPTAIPLHRSGKAELRVHRH